MKRYGKKTTVKSAVLLALSLLCACGAMKGETFSVPADYREWKKPHKGILDYEVPGHGKSFRIIYASPAAWKPEKKKNGALIIRDGAVIIKETYGKYADIKKKNYKNLTIMVKDSSGKGALRGWHYYMKGKDKPVMGVKGRMCIGCHEAANDPHPYFDGNKKGAFRDYLFVPFR